MTHKVRGVVWRVVTRALVPPRAGPGSQAAGVGVTIALDVAHRPQSGGQVGGHAEWRGIYALPAR